MNLRSIDMGRALDTLTQESRIIPTIMFLGSESVSYGIGEETLPDVMELEEQCQLDEDVPAVV